MTKQLVVSIATDGEINHTLKDGVFKLDAGTTRQVQRMSEIVHDTATDKFYVQRMDGRPFVVERINSDLEINFCSKERRELYTDKLVGYTEIKNATGVTPVWDTYEEAVAFEVRLINLYRLKGLPIPGFVAE